MICYNNRLVYYVSTSHRDIGKSTPTLSTVMVSENVILDPSGPHMNGTKIVWIKGTA